ncbi:hypothetical protein PAXRUDRAFT_165021, partial [Paxillus rubicundulus Ve08.2h10]
LKLVSSLLKRHISLIFWLCTTHIALNKHLHHLKKIASPLCPYCKKKIETVEHYLTSCPQYAHECHILRNALGRSAGSVSFLLTQPKAINPLIIFVNSTSRLKETFGNVHPKSDKTA